MIGVRGVIAYLGTAYLGIACVGIVCVGIVALGACDLVFPLDVPPADAPLLDVSIDAPRTYAEIVLADHPLSYWRLGDSGAIAKDEMSVSPGTYRGAIDHTLGALAGDLDQAATFDGTTYVEVGGNRLDFLATSPFTIEAWVNPKQLIGFAGVVSRDEEASGGNQPHRGYHLYSDVGTVGFERANNASVQDAHRTTPLPVNTWSYVVVTFDGSALTLYVDAGMVVTSSAPLTPIPMTTGPFLIGARADGTIQRFVGAIDEVALYDHALTPQQIDHHHAVGLGAL